MRSLVIAILPLLVVGCAGHDAGTGMEVSAVSRSVRADLPQMVSAIVRSYARERGFPLDYERPSRPRFQRYAVEPGATDLYVFPEPDVVRIEISEIGVSRPSRKHRDIQRDLKARFEAASLVVTRTDPHIVVTF